MVPKNNRALRLHLGHNGTDFSCFPPDRSFKFPPRHFSPFSSSLPSLSPALRFLVRPTTVQKQQKTIIRRTQQMRNRFRGLLCTALFTPSPLSRSHTIFSQSLSPFLPPLGAAEILHLRFAKNRYARQTATKKTSYSHHLTTIMVTPR